MVKVGFLLHFYQPSTQFGETLQKINVRSYEPLLSVFEDFPEARFTVNLTGSLLELWEKSGREDIIKRWQAVLKKGNIEVVGTAKYHPLLLRLPESEISRQIVLQEQMLKQVLGLARPAGFFPPELGYSETVAEAVAKRGYRWIMVDRSGRPGAGFPGTPELAEKTYAAARLRLGVVFREPDLSYQVAFAIVKSVSAFDKVLERLDGHDGYLILAMDAETFGWHRKTQLNFLRTWLRACRQQGRKFELVGVSQIFDEFPESGEVEALDSSWGFFRETATGVRVFPRWDNPENPVHNLQWRLLKLAIETSATEPEGSLARNLLDQGEQSDQFWWASADPCWMPALVAAGANLLERSVLSSSQASEERKKEASRLALEILDVGREHFGKRPRRC